MIRRSIRQTLLDAGYREYSGRGDGAEGFRIYPPRNCAHRICHVSYLLPVEGLDRLRVRNERWARHEDFLTLLDAAGFPGLDSDHRSARVILPDAPPVGVGTLRAELMARTRQVGVRVVAWESGLSPSTARRACAGAGLSPGTLERLEVWWKVYACGGRV